MSAFANALSAVKHVLLLRDEVDRLRFDLTGLADDVGGMVGDLRGVEQRLARLEGFVEGVAATRAQPRLPRK